MSLEEDYEEALRLLEAMLNIRKFGKADPYVMPIKRWDSAAECLIRKNNIPYNDRLTHERKTMSDKNDTTPVDVETSKSKPNLKKIAMIAAGSLTALAAAVALWNHLGEDSETDVVLAESFTDNDTDE